MIDDSVLSRVVDAFQHGRRIGRKSRGLTANPAPEHGIGNPRVIYKTVISRIIDTFEHVARARPSWARRADLGKQLPFGATIRSWINCGTGCDRDIGTAAATDAVVSLISGATKPIAAPSVTLAGWPSSPVRTNWSSWSRRSRQTRCRDRDWTYRGPGRGITGIEVLDRHPIQGFGGN